jgi:hypothetical protein
LLEHGSKKPPRQEISHPLTRICGPLAITGRPLSESFRRDLPVLVEMRFGGNLVVAVRHFTANAGQIFAALAFFCP